MKYLTIILFKTFKTSWSIVLYNLTYRIHLITYKNLVINKTLEPKISRYTTFGNSTYNVKRVRRGICLVIWRSSLKSNVTWDCLTKLIITQVKSVSIVWNNYSYFLFVFYIDFICNFKFLYGSIWGKRLLVLHDVFNQICQCYCYSMIRFNNLVQRSITMFFNNKGFSFLFREKENMDWMIEYNKKLFAMNWYSWIGMPLWVL